MWCSPSTPQPNADAGRPRRGHHSNDAVAWHKRRQLSGSEKWEVSHLHLWGPSGFLKTQPFPANSNHSPHLSASSKETLEPIGPIIMAHQCPQPVILLDSWTDSWIICFCSSPFYRLCFHHPSLANCSAHSSNCFDARPCNDFGRAQLSKRSCGFPGEVSPYFAHSINIIHWFVLVYLDYYQPTQAMPSHALHHIFRT